jgi:hypothetical protein
MLLNFVGKARHIAKAAFFSAQPEFCHHEILVVLELGSRNMFYHTNFGGEGCDHFRK